MTTEAITPPSEDTTVSSDDHKNPDSLFNNPNPAFQFGCWMALAVKVHNIAHGGDTLEMAATSVVETPQKSLGPIVHKVRVAMRKVTQDTNKRSKTEKVRKYLDITFYRFSEVWSREGFPKYLSDEDKLLFWTGYWRQESTIRMWERDALKGALANKKNGKAKKANGKK